MPQPTTIDTTSVLNGVLYSNIADKFQQYLLKPAFKLQFQFPALPTVADWYPNESPLYAQYLVGDVAPAAHGDTYLPRPADLGASVFSNYRMFTGALLTPDVSSDTQYKKYANELAKLLGQYKGHYTQAANDFVAYTHSEMYDPNIKTVEEYLASPWAGSIAGLIKGDLTQIDQKKTQMDEYVSKADPRLRAATQAVKKTVSYTTPSKTTIDAGDTTIGSGTYALQAHLPQWQTGQFLTGGFGPVTLTTGTVPVHKLETIWIEEHHERSVFFGLWSEDETTWTKFTIDVVSYEGFKLDVSLSGIACYGVSRTWLDPAFLDGYKTKPLGGDVTAAEFFSPEKGDLTLIPAYVIVGFDPVLTLTMSTKAFNTYKDAIINKGMKIGPFLVGGDNLPKANVISSTDTETVIRFAAAKEDMVNEAPYVLGYAHYVTTV